MALEPELSHLIKDRYDIFLCTRGLPDALTPETAAIRQLMSALIGRGCKVFFPSALPADTAPEELAAAMAAALGSAPVMIAAAVGDVGASDATARFLWKRYRELADAGPGRCFLACVRDLSALPEELQGAEVLDMSELGFLSQLQERLNAVLSEPERPEEKPEPAEEIPEPAEEPKEAEKPEEETEEAESAEAEDAEAESAEPEGLSPRRRKLFLALAIGAAALVLLGLALLVFIK